MATVLLVSICPAARATAQQDTLQAPGDSQEVAPMRDMRGAPLIPVEPLQTAPGPLAPGARYTFTRDSILWSSALTLTDLLTAIPGVYVARGGFLGQPEYIQYGGRGGGALEVYWDGVRVEPVGADTLFLDPGRIALSYLRRVDVEVLPASLRVNLISERHEGIQPRSVVQVTSGSFGTSAYSFLFQKRWSNGIGADLAFDFTDTDGTAADDQPARVFDLWGKVGWMPSARTGALLQIRRQRQERDAVTVQGETGIRERFGVRRDVQFSLFASTRSDGLGLLTEAGVGASMWSADSGSNVPDRSIRFAFGRARYRQSRWNLGVSARVADERTPWTLEGHAGVVPVPGIVLAGAARASGHEGDRTSSAAHASLGLHRGPFALVGTLALQDAVQAPAVLADTSIRTNDRSLKAMLRTRLLTGSVGLVYRDAFQPLPYPDLPAVPTLTASPAATYLVADAHVRVSSVISLSGWYSDPVDGTPASLQPPKHGRAEITLRSKYWRTFRSGAFDLKVRWAMESWSTGVAGLDALGQPITLDGATFFEAHIEFQIVRFTGFWTLRNARLTEADFVPGLDYPKNVQTFGVSWTFSN